MAVLDTLTFDGLAEDAVIDTAAVGGAWSVVKTMTGDPLAKAAAAAHGARGAQVVTPNGVARYIYTETTTATRCVSMYFKLQSTPSAATYLGEMASSGTNRADWRVNSNGTVTLRNAFTATGGTSSETLTVGVWYRSEWLTSTTGQELRIYVGESTTPYIAITGALTNNSHTIVVSGITASPNSLSLDVDTIRVGDDWVGPFVTSTPDPVVAHWVTGAGLVDLTGPRFYTGSAWTGLERGVITPATPPLPAMILGSSAGTGTTFSAWNAECINDGSKDGAANLGLGLHRTYSGGSIVSDFMTTAAATDVAAGVASMWSCKPNLETVNGGSLDATFTSFFNSIPAGHRAYLMMWHEPWDDQFNWATFRNAQARVWNLLKDSNADPNLVSWGILGTGWDFIQGWAQTNFFPAGGEYDWVGVDEYDFYRNLSTMPPSPRNRNGHRKANVMFGPCVSFAASVGKPVVVGEFGLHSDPSYLDGPMSPAGVPSKPYRLADILDYFIDNGVEAAAYFHSPNGDDGPWWLSAVHNFSSPQDLSTPDPASVAMWRNYLALHGKQA